MPLEIGTQAPTFTLKSKKADGLVDVTIPAAGKNTVLLFFPLAFTSVCTDEMCSVTQGLGSFAGAEVIAVSVDSPFARRYSSACGERDDARQVSAAAASALRGTSSTVS